MASSMISTLPRVTTSFSVPEAGTAGLRVFGVRVGREREQRQHDGAGDDGGVEETHAGASACGRYEEFGGGVFHFCLLLVE